MYNKCIELCNSFISRFCKVPPQLCDGSTVIHDICSSSSSTLSVTENKNVHWEIHFITYLDAPNDGILYHNSR